MSLSDVWKIAMLATGPAGESIVNTFHYFSDVTPEPTINADALAVAADIALVGNFGDLVTADWVYAKVTALSVHGLNVGKSGESQNSLGTTGSLLAPSGPLTQCLVGKRKGNGVGRHSRGRIFISPVTDSIFDIDGRVTLPGGYLATYQTFNLTTFALAGTLFKPCLWDIVHQQAIEITSGSIGSYVGIQKRRRLRLPN